MPSSEIQRFDPEGGCGMEHTRNGRWVTAEDHTSRLLQAERELDEERSKLEAQTKELAFQAFVAGAQLFAGPDLEEPRHQFERHWEEQRGHAIDAEEGQA
jgi:hypothetical protein